MNNAIPADRRRDHQTSQLVTRSSMLTLDTNGLPAVAQAAVGMRADQLRETQEKIDAVTARIEAGQKADPRARRLAKNPGVGMLTASAIAASCRRRASGTT